MTDKLIAVWTYERDAKQHFMPFEAGGTRRFMLVYKTGGGDYAITCMSDGDPCGGDVDYEPTLPKAKAKAEALAKSGGWVELAA